MKKGEIYFFSIILVIVFKTVYSQPVFDYYSRNNFLNAPASTFQNGLVGFTNPANLQFVNKFESRFLWNTNGTDAASFNDWGFFSGVRHFGFGMLRQSVGNKEISDYRISTAFGSQGCAFGLAYGWLTGDFNTSGRGQILTTGTIIRPFSYMSVGIVGNFSLKRNAREGIAAIGIRPLGSPRLTLFTDAAMQNETKLSAAPWSAGAVLRIQPGINLTGRYFDSDAFTVGLTVNFGKNGTGSKFHFDSEHKHSCNSYMVRFGGTQPSLFPKIFDKNKRYLALNLKGRIEYQRYVLFDKNTRRFMDILKDIRAAIDDPRVKAVALNLSSMRVRPENAWEIREELKKLQKADKKVVVFIDWAGMTTYHLASVADVIVMDPEGSLALPGYHLGRTYLKGVLDKLGLGFDEWRFFKYKSAMEEYSRKNMSDADREQRQAYVDDWYELVQDDVGESRNISRKEFDRLIDEEAFFMPKRALKAGLVDTLARWSDIHEIIKSVNGSRLRKIVSKDLFKNVLPLQQWGEKPKIAVVYGLGVCDMDRGIRARWLERVFLKLSKNKPVKAIVFRVDSPGGYGIASDLVAEAIKKCKAKKPVIISQGQVAASGGYWLSMYGDRIVAAPNTITGSIGVIGGWIYDKGFTDKLGLTSDCVKRGSHADLGFGARLPFTRIKLPARNLTSEERGKMELIIKQFYDNFVKKVAMGRSMSIEEVRKIAEGHIYSGTDGKQIGLVDEIGGLFTAIAIARQKAGLQNDSNIEIIEIPKNKGLINVPTLFPSIKTAINDDSVLEYIRMKGENPWLPLPMLLPGTYPAAE